LCSWFHYKRKGKIINIEPVNDEQFSYRQRKVRGVWHMPLQFYFNEKGKFMRMEIGD
jgi:hypothetical protein